MKFIQQAYKGINDWWAYLVTIVLFIFGWQFIGVLPLGIVAFLKADNVTEFGNAANNSFASLGINNNLFLFLIIISFLFGLVFLFLGIKFIHKRKILSVITSRKKIDWCRVFFSFSIWFVIGVIMIAISYFLNPEAHIWNFKPIPFLILVLISFLFLPIQTSLEELLFRGYLMQGFGTWFKKGIWALILTSVIFGLMHGLNPEVQELGWMLMVYYIGTGLLLGIFTIMDEGTELSLGFHAANNIVAAVFVTKDWVVFQTDALFVDTSEPSLELESFLPVFVLYPLIIIFFSKKYGWNNWKYKLLGKVYKPIELNEDEFIA